jgi:hypothetical protein
LCFACQAAASGTLVKAEKVQQKSEVKGQKQPPDYTFQVADFSSHLTSPFGCEEPMMKLMVTFWQPDAQKVNICEGAGLQDAS